MNVMNNDNALLGQLPGQHHIVKLFSFFFQHRSLIEASSNCVTR